MESSLDLGSAMSLAQSAAFLRLRQQDGQQHLLVRLLNLALLKQLSKALSLRLVESLTQHRLRWLQRLALLRKLLEMWYLLHFHKLRRESGSLLDALKCH
jgi:hypothetical protein